jgi:serine/threonine protein kinase
MNTSILFCENCGAENTVGKKYCSFCGKYLQNGISNISNPITSGLASSPKLLRQRYRILTTIGHGGMGVVYKAEDVQLGNRIVAIKEMDRANLNPQEVLEAAESFKREAHMLAGLNHPNLPSIHEYFEEQECWYLVMSYVEGQTFEDYLVTKGGKLPLAETLATATILCSVLSYLHTHQPPIIFRDLKPANIMRTPVGHIYLIAFGIARHFKPGQAKDTANYGSAGYAPPEQYGRAQTTPRSDIYSLGVMLYQLLSGYDPSLSPFRFPTLIADQLGIPTRLADLIAQMIELDESKRPSNMSVVQEGILQLSLSSTPILNAQREQTSFKEQPVYNQVEEPVRVYNQVVEPVRNENSQLYELNRVREIPIQQQSSLQMYFAPPTSPIPPVSNVSSWRRRVLLVVGIVLGLAFTFIGDLGFSSGFGDLINHVANSNLATDYILSSIFLLSGLFLLVRSTISAIGKYVGLPILILGIIIGLAGFVSNGQFISYFVGGAFVILTGAIMYLFSRNRKW